MPMDRRIITFSEGELKEAIFNYCRAMGRKLPDPAMARLRISAAPPITATIDGLTPGEVTILEESDIAAALILFCRKENIPLPREAVKSLKLANASSIALCTLWQSSRKRMHAADLFPVKQLQKIPFA